MLTLNATTPKLSRYAGQGLSELENYYALLNIDSLGDLGLVEAENYFSNALSLEEILEKNTTQLNKDIAEIFDNPVATASEDLFLNDIFNNPLTIMGVTQSSRMVLETNSSWIDGLVDSLMGLMNTGTTNIDTTNIKGVFDTPITSTDNTNRDNLLRHLENLIPAPERQVANEETQSVSDGVIDHFNQGQVGNCWFLATIDAYAQTAEGRATLSESIKTDSQGNYNVTFASDPNFEFTITPEEIEERRKTAGVSSGDIDMQILELAYEKLQTSRMEERGLPGIHIWEALSGEKLEGSGDLPTREHADALLKDITGGIGLTKGFGISFHGGVNMGTGEAVYYDNTEGHNSGHSFALTSIDWDNRTITYENPWDTKNTRTMSLDAFYELLEKGGSFNWTDNNPL